MWANSFWGLLGLAVTFGLTVLLLGPDQIWLRPYFLAAAFLSALGWGIILIWPLLRHLWRKLRAQYNLIDLKDAAAQLYGELRGTDLGRFTEGHTGSESEILDNLGMQILHNADVYVRRAPSPKWEVFPRSELNKMGVCGGATGIRYWGEKQPLYSDPQVSKRELRRVSRYLKQNANFVSEWSKAPPPEPSPLEIIFDPTNPGRKYWSIEPIRDENGKPIGTHWEYRALIKNNSPKTLRNVKVVVEATGPLPHRPESSHFDINKQQLIDLHPQDEALAVIRRWFNPPIVVGMACGTDIYGPIKMTASADDVPPTTKLFHFNPEQTPMIFE